MLTGPWTFSALRRRSEKTSGNEDRIERLGAFSAASLGTIRLSHTMTDPSRDAVASRPTKPASGTFNSGTTERNAQGFLGSHATCFTLPECPTMVARHSLRSTSKILAVWSPEPVAIIASSAEKRASKIGWMGCAETTLRGTGRSVLGEALVRWKEKREGGITPKLDKLARLGSRNTRVPSWVARANKGAPVPSFVPIQAPKLSGSCIRAS